MNLSNTHRAACVWLLGLVVPALGENSPQVAPATTDAALPAAVDLRPKFADFGLAPRSQGRRNTCSVFTTVGALEFAASRRAAAGKPLSVEYLNWACNQVIGNKTQDRGQFFHHLLQAFQEYGVCAAADMPYGRRFDPELAPAPEVVAKARELVAGGLAIHWIRPLTKEQGLSDEQFREVKTVLAQGWPVAAGSDHSRLLVGYQDDAAQPGGGTFVTKDSGAGGYGQVTYEFVRTRVGDAFWVESAQTPAAASAGS